MTLLRAVKNAPDSARKGHLGHGICDHLTRSVTLSTFTDDGRVVGREAAKMVLDLKVSRRRHTPLQHLLLTRWRTCRAHGCNACRSTCCNSCHTLPLNLLQLMSYPAAQPAATHVIPCRSTSRRLCLCL